MASLRNEKSSLSCYDIASGETVATFEIVSCCRFLFTRIAIVSPLAKYKSRDIIKVIANCYFMSLSKIHAYICHTSGRKGQVTAACAVFLRTGIKYFVA